MYGEAFFASRDRTRTTASPSFLRIARLFFARMERVRNVTPLRMPPGLDLTPGISSRLHKCLRQLLTWKKIYILGGWEKTIVLGSVMRHFLHSELPLFLLAQTWTTNKSVGASMVRFSSLEVEIPTLNTSRPTRLKHQSIPLSLTINVNVWTLIRPLASGVRSELINPKLHLGKTSL